jgi:hypothetical protein
VIGPDEQIASIWQELYQLIRAQTSADGPNPTGKLAGVNDVQKSISLWTGKAPAIGVQLRDVPEMPDSPGRHKISLRFAIVVGASSVETDARKANLTDAMASLVPLLADGNGNGLGPLLRGNFGLNGLAYRTSISSAEFSWSDIEGAGAGVPIWAYAMYTYVAQTLVTF